VVRVDQFFDRPPFGTMQLAHQQGTAEFGERSAQGHGGFLSP
jgi:hypothetical protein